MDRLFTVCYLPICLLFIAGLIQFPHIASTRARILTSFSSFTLIMLLVPVVSDDVACSLSCLIGHGFLVACRTGSGCAACHSPCRSMRSCAVQIDAAVLGQQQGSQAALALVLLAVVLVGACDGFCQGAVFGEAAASMVPENTHVSARMRTACWAPLVTAAQNMHAAHVVRAGNQGLHSLLKHAAPPCMCHGTWPIPCCRPCPCAMCAGGGGRHRVLRVPHLPPAHHH